MEKTMLSGKEADEFLDWFVKINKLLPPKMSIRECKDLFIRKKREDDEAKKES
jgi:hypothetical protein